MKNIFHLRILTACSLLLSVIAASTTAIAQANGISQAATGQIELLLQEKSSRTPAQNKIDSRLLLQSRRARNDPMLRAMSRLRTNVQAEVDGRILVDLNASVDSELLVRIANLGGSVINSHSRYNAVRALLPLDAIQELAASQKVRLIRPADKASTHMINTSEGDVAHATNTLRMASGINGFGIKTCALSDSIESLASLQASGDLPAVTVLPGQAGTGISEGTAMLEIIHDLAPASELMFATAFGGQAQFAQNIINLRTAGCNVLVDDIFYFAEPPFQDGIIAQAVTAVVNDGAFYFSSAGNAGNLNDGTSGTWEGDYNPTTLPAPLVGSGLSAHNFGGNNFNTITRDSPFGFSLFWSDPQGASANDYDLFLLDAAGTAVLGSSTNTQNGTQDPFEFISSSTSNDVNYRLVVVLFSGANRFVHLSTIRGRLNVATNGETKGHSAAVAAFSVAAVNVASAGGGEFTGGASNPVESFSSNGPRRMFFEANGTPYTAGNFSSTGGLVRQKPDIAAADGVATATPGFNPFFGTSAAAPHAAAIAALHLQINRSLTNTELRNLFAASALDIEAPGIDQDSGMGIIMAPDETLLAENECSFFVFQTDAGNSMAVCL